MPPQYLPARAPVARDALSLGVQPSTRCANQPVDGALRTPRRGRAGRPRPVYASGSPATVARSHPNRGRARAVDAGVHDRSTLTAVASDGLAAVSDAMRAAGGLPPRPSVGGARPGRQHRSRRRFGWQRWLAGSIARPQVVDSTDAPLAQLDRASGYEPEGRRFESCRARHPPSLACKSVRAMADGALSSFARTQFPCELRRDGAGALGAAFGAILCYKV